MSSLVYPLTVKNGDIVLTNDPVDVSKDAIESSIRTKIDERVRNPDYGRTVEPFTAIDDYGAIARQVRQSVEYGTEGYDLSSLSVMVYPRDEITGVDIGFTLSDQQQTYTTQV